MTIEALRRQKLRNAQFQCRSIMDQLLYINKLVTWALEDALILRPIVASYPIQPGGCFSEDQIENTHRLVTRAPSFEPTSYTHLCVVSGYLGGIVLPGIVLDHRQLQSDGCGEGVIDRWQCWESIQERLGFQLPILGLTGLHVDEMKQAVGVVLQGAWTAVRAAAPTSVEQGCESESKGAGTIHRSGRDFSP